MPIRTRATLEVSGVRLERLAAEYRAVITAGLWPRVVYHEGTDHVYFAPWAPRRESPDVCQTDADGWVDSNNNCLVIPCDVPEHRGMWRASPRYGLVWHGVRFYNYYGVDAAECMAWVDIVRDEECRQRETEREAERTQTEPSRIWNDFNHAWSNAYPGEYMPEHIIHSSFDSARETWNEAHQRWLAAHPDEIPDWAAIREEAKVRWAPDLARWLELEVSEEELDAEFKAWNGVQAERVTQREEE